MTACRPPGSRTALAAAAVRDRAAQDRRHTRRVLAARVERAARGRRGGLTLAFGARADQMFGVFFERTVGTAGVLIPVLGILAVTSEWSQRTAVTTFALVPRRDRVIAAKLLAGLALALAAVGVCLAMSLAATALVPVVGHGGARGTSPPPASGARCCSWRSGWLARRRARAAGDELGAGDRAELPDPVRDRRARHRHPGRRAHRCGGSISGRRPAS